MHRYPNSYYVHILICCSAILPYTAIVVIVLYYLSLRLLSNFRKTNRELKRLHSVNSGKVLTIVSESTIGVSTIRAFNKQDYFINLFVSSLSLEISSDYNSTIAFAWMAARLNLLANCLFLSVVIILSVLIFLDTSIPYGSLSLALTYALLMNE